MTLNDEATEFTFTLREGHKWSDGAPVTTEDVRFAYEDVLSNELLNSSVPSYLKDGGVPTGAPATLEIVDEVTFKFVFSAPYPGFTANLVNLGTGYLDIIKPQHFLAQYHIDYGDADEIAAMVAEENLDEWHELFNQVDITGWTENSEQAIGFPQLGPWVRVEGPEEHVLTERNPYYFAVDAAGNQLPYLDSRRAVMNQWENMEAADLMMFAGDAHYLWAGGLSGLPLYIENEVNGNYVTYIYPNRDSRMFFLNLSYDDPTWREVTWDVRFRQAVQLALDNQEIINDLYFGQAKLPTTVPGEYDVEEANRLLDEMGMTERDAGGFRLAPSGEPFEILIEVDAAGGEYADLAPFIVDYLTNVGIKIDFKGIDGTLLGERRQANEAQAGIMWNTAPMWAAHIFPDYIPTDTWGPAWQDWYESDGESGEAPPDWIMELYAIHEELISHPPGTDEFMAAEVVRDEWLYENIPFFTYVENPGLAHLWSNCIGNVADGPFHHGSWSNHKLIYMKAECQ